MMLEEKGAAEAEILTRKRKWAREQSKQGKVQREEDKKEIESVRKSL